MNKKYGPIEVTGGEAFATLGRDIGTGFVDGAGNFRVEVPLDREAKAAGTSDVSINNGAVTVILTGSLAQQTGLLTFGVAEFANAGCATSVTYKQI